MITINLSAADVEALRYWRFQHPDPRVQVRMEALYLRSQRMANRDILRLCGISKASFHRYLNAYITGGIEQLKQIDQYRPQSALAPYRPTLEAYFREHPPATVAAAAAQINSCQDCEGVEQQNLAFVFQEISTNNVFMYIPGRMKSNKTFMQKNY